MSSEPVAVYHVGRAGDIPGGMTQVINAYLAWPFARTRVEVLTSRADPGDHVRAARLFAGAVRRLRRIARSGQDAVVVVHLSEGGSFVREGALARYAARLGLPVVAHLHGSEFVAYDAAHHDRVAAVLRSAAVVITLSEESSVIAAAHVGADRVHLVPNAIPEGAPTDKTRTAVFGGVVSHRKGIDVLQDAWRVAAPDGWRLLVAGPVRDAHLVDESVAGVEWLGSLDHDALMSLLDAASVAVLPSRDEAMPMFILEAMARRACVISTNVGGIPAVLSDGAGVLVDAADVDALATAIARVAGDDAARESIAAAGYARYRERYSATTVFPAVEELWLAARDATPAKTGVST